MVTCAHTCQGLLTEATSRAGAGLQGRTDSQDRRSRQSRARPNEADSPARRQRQRRQPRQPRQPRRPSSFLLPATSSSRGSHPSLSVCLSSLLDHSPIKRHWFSLLLSDCCLVAWLWGRRCPELTRSSTLAASAASPRHPWMGLTCVRSNSSRFVVESESPL